MSRIRDWIKRSPRRRRIALFAIRLFSPFAGLWNISALFRYFSFIADWYRFRQAGGKTELLELHPCLFDKTSATAIDSHYFHQSIWAFKKIHASRTEKHVDIGSDTRFVGMLTCITAVTFIDLRPLKLNLERYEGMEGSVLALPFVDSSVMSVSCLHVIEHIGLGRYGDPIDPEGSLKASQELKRILAPGGYLYVSVPIGRRRVQFNSQRIFSIKDVLAMFSNLTLIELSIVNTDGEFYKNVVVTDVFLKEGYGLDYGLGMFVFSAPLRK